MEVLEGASWLALETLGEVEIMCKLSSLEEGEPPVLDNSLQHNLSFTGHSLDNLTCLQSPGGLIKCKSFH